jgi:hypothetical protein
VIAVGNARDIRRKTVQLVGVERSSAFDAFSKAKSRFAITIQERVVAFPGMDCSVFFADLKALDPIDHSDSGRFCHGQGVPSFALLNHNTW